MIRTINALGTIGQITGTVLLAWLFVVTALFVLRYVTTLPWYASEEGRHLVAMTANIWAFAAIYLVQLLWPEIPDRLRQWLLLSLLVIFVGNCTWRWVMLERHLRRRRKR